MDKNKSIDGLVTRRSKKSATITRKTKTSPTKTAQKSAKTITKPAKTTTKSPKTVRRSTKSSINKPKSLDITTNSTEPQSIASTKPTPQSKPTPHSSTDDFLKPIQAFEFDEQSGELKAAEPNTMEDTNKKSKKSKKPISKKRKIITGIILTLIVILIGGVIWFIIWGNDILAKITGGQGNIFDLFSEHYEPLKTDANGRTNILAFGTSGYNMEGEEGEGTHDGAQLTDSIMVISLDQETGDFAMLSLPRDFKVSSTCTGTGKINEVYWCNNQEGDNEQAGAEALMQEVGDVLGVDFQYYAHLNWGSLVQIVDTLGGIKVTLDEDISDYYFTGSVYEAGVEYELTGIQAVALSRARHGTESGDFSRGASQQKIVIGIKNKALEKNLSLTEILSIASTLGDNLRTNFSVDELKTLAHIGIDLDFETMRQVSLVDPEQLVTTGTLNGISYVLPTGGAGNYSRIQSYIAKMFSSDPRSYEDASILVLNGTETPGLASTEQNSLENDGYHNIYTDDTPATGASEQYTLYAVTDKAPKTKQLLEEKYNISAKTINELPGNISRDYDFVIIINSSSHE